MFKKDLKELAIQVRTLAEHNRTQLELISRLTDNFHDMVRVIDNLGQRIIVLEEEVRFLERGGKE